MDLESYRLKFLKSKPESIRLNLFRQKTKTHSTLSRKLIHSNLEQAHCLTAHSPITPTRLTPHYLYLTPHGLSLSLPLPLNKFTFQVRVLLPL